MMRSLAWTAAFGCLLLAGCNTPHRDLAKGGDPVPGGSPTPSGSSDPNKGAVPKSTTPSGGAEINSAATPKADPAPNVTPGVKAVPSKEVPTLDSPDWQPFKMKPVEIAAKIDDRFRHLEGADGDIRLHLIIPIGEGTMTTYCRAASNQRFSVTYPVIDGSPPNVPLHLQRVGVIGNGGQMSDFHPGRGKDVPAFSPRRPYKAGGSENGVSVLAKWPTEMPRLAMSHFITGKDVFVPLVRALSAPGSGFTVRSEQRTSTEAGRKYVYYRILADKIDSKTRRSLAQYEIVVDAHMFVPLTMRTHVTPPGKNAIVVEWAGRWDKLKIDPKMFELPY